MLFSIPMRNSADFSLDKDDILITIFPVASFGFDAESKSEVHAYQFDSTTNKAIHKQKIILSKEVISAALFSHPEGV